MEWWLWMRMRSLQGLSDLRMVVVDGGGGDDIEEKQKYGTRNAYPNLGRLIGYAGCVILGATSGGFPAVLLKCSVQSQSRKSQIISVEAGCRLRLSLCTLCRAAPVHAKCISRVQPKVFRDSLCAQHATMLCRSSTVLFAAFFLSGFLAFFPFLSFLFLSFFFGSS